MIMVSWKKVFIGAGSANFCTDSKSCKSKVPIQSKRTIISTFSMTPSAACSSTSFLLHTTLVSVSALTSRGGVKHSRHIMPSSRPDERSVTTT